MEVDTVAWDELRIIRLLEYIATEGKRAWEGVCESTEGGWRISSALVQV